VDVDLGPVESDEDYGVDHHDGGKDDPSHAGIRPAPARA
jgi:hypothetical protein